MYLVIIWVVPFVSLALLNLRIYVQIRHSQAERAKLTRQEQREIGMATMLICVVIVFFVCNVLALVVNLLEVRHSSHFSNCSIAIFLADVDRHHSPHPGV